MSPEDQGVHDEAAGSIGRRLAAKDLLADDPRDDISRHPLNGSILPAGSPMRATTKDQTFPKRRQGPSAVGPSQHGLDSPDDSRHEGDGCCDRLLHATDAAAVRRRMFPALTIKDH
jgi:hypothetical protein